MFVARIVFVCRDVTAVDHYKCGLLAGNSPAWECWRLNAMHEAPLLCLNEMGCMLSCAYFTVVRGVQLHYCCAPETKCSENASVCSCCSVCGAGGKESFVSSAVGREKSDLSWEEFTFWKFERELEEEELLHVEWSGNNIINFSCFILHVSLHILDLRPKGKPQRIHTVQRYHSAPKNFLKFLEHLHVVLPASLAQF